MKNLPVWKGMEQIMAKAKGADKNGLQQLDTREERRKALEEVIAQVEKQYGPGSLMRLGQNKTCLLYTSQKSRPGYCLILIFGRFLCRVRRRVHHVAHEKRVFGHLIQ